MSDRALAMRVNALVATALANTDFSFTLEERGSKCLFHRYLLHHIRHRVDTDDVGVVDAPQRLENNVSVAAYDAVHDVVYVNASKLGDAEARFTLAHEYTHAAVDIRKYVFTRASNEGVAFLVERLCRGFGTHVDHAAHPTIGKDPLSIKLYDAAEALMMSKKLATDKSAVISAAEFKPLRDAVIAFYSATLGPLFQPEQVMDWNLGTKFPSNKWKDW